MAFATNNPPDEIAAFNGFSEMVEGKVDIKGTPDAISIEDLKKEFESRNPLGMIEGRKYYYKYTGSLNSCPGGMIDAATDNTIAAYQRDPTERPDYDYLRQGLEDKPVAREGDVSHAYVTKILIEDRFSNFPIPFAMEIHGVKGDQYHHTLETDPSWRSLAIIHPVSEHEYNPPKLLHQLPANLNIAEVVAYDNLDLQEITNHLAVFSKVPEWTVVLGGMDNPILPLIARPENLNQLRALGFTDKVEIVHLPQLGDAMTIKTWVAEASINAIKRTACKARELSPRVNINKLACQWHPVSSKPGITMANIHEHEYFDGKSKEEIDAVLNRVCHIAVNLRMDFALKDDVMESKIRERLQQQQQSAVLQ